MLRTCFILSVLAVQLAGCAELKPSDTAAPRDSRPPLVLLASAAETGAASLQDGPASLPGDSPAFERDKVADAPTPEAAQILKEHGYDPAESRSLAKENQVAQAPTQAGGQMPIPEVDPFAPTDEGLEEYDPFERVNQYSFEFNYKLDRYLIKPVAKAYNRIMPDLAQRSISNFFTNIRFVPRLLNNVLQLKLGGAAIEGSRFLINTTVGIGGLFDPAKAWLNLDTPVEDSGQTFGYYGVKPGPYLVIPLLGSFTLRDGVGYIADLALDPFNWFVLPIIKLNGAPKLVTHEDTITFAQIGMRAGIIVNERSLNLEKFQGVEEATLDLYAAVRNAYLQQRARLIRE
jgi:phospholipid-binding lipoprotein MlaA